MFTQEEILETVSILMEISDEEKIQGNFQDAEFYALEAMKLLRKIDFSNRH